MKPLHLKEKYLPPKILGHTKNVKTVLDKQGERCLPTAPIRKLREEALHRQPEGSKKQEDAESGKQEIQLGERGGGVLTLMGGLGRESQGGNPRVLAAESNTSSLGNARKFQERLLS